MPYRLTSEWHAIPYEDGDFILYAPLIGFVAAVNADLISLLYNLEGLEEDAFSTEERRVLGVLIAKGLVNGRDVTPRARQSAPLIPTKLTLFPTSLCTLRCRYCYAMQAGGTPRTMDFGVARDSVDYFLGVLRRTGGTEFPLEFHGGGEPLLAWSLVKQIVEYAEQRCREESFRLNAFAGTNGMLNEQQLEWLVAHFGSLSVSFDVLPRVQDYQRATISGSGTFETVDRTVRFLDAHNFPYQIRCTVGSFNEDLLEETVAFVKRNYRTHILYMEPVSYSGCGSTEADHLQADLVRFGEAMKRLEPVCAQAGIRLAFSSGFLERLGPTFCYVGTDDFAVTPDGYLTNCWEVTHGEHPLADPFLFGRMLPGGTLDINEERLAYLRTLTLDNLVSCRDCFARWHCAGGCVTKLGHRDYLGSRPEAQCALTRDLLAHRLRRLLNTTPCFEREANRGSPAFRPVQEWPWRTENCS